MVSDEKYLAELANRLEKTAGSLRTAVEQDRWPDAWKITREAQRMAYEAETRVETLLEDAACPEVVEIAHAFARVLHHEIGGDTLREVNRRNRDPDYPVGACATHDYCDANVYMAQAIRMTGREPPMTEGETDDERAERTRLWNRAWNLAKACGFWRDQPEVWEGEDA